MMQIKQPKVAAIVTPEPARDAQGRELIGVEYLLQWAFVNECAGLDHDEVGAVGPQGFASVSVEYRIGQQLALGDGRGVGVRVDTSVGRSYPHSDADIVASVVRSSASYFAMAVSVASYARARARPVWDIGPPRVVPIAWVRENQHAPRAKTERIGTCEYRSKRGLVRVPVMVCPITIEASPARAAAARRAYLDWWGALHAINSALKCVELQRFSLTGILPPRAPWKKTVDSP